MLLGMDALLRPHLARIIHQARISLVAAPRGYGKSSLIEGYLRLYPQPYVLVDCLSDDRLAPHLADHFVREFSRELRTDLLASLHAQLAAMSCSPEELGQILAAEIQRWDGSLLIIFNGLPSQEAAAFALELARQTPQRFRFILTGYPFLAAYKRPGDYLLQAEHLQYVFFGIGRVGHFLGGRAGAGSLARYD